MMHVSVFCKYRNRAIAYHPSDLLFTRRAHSWGTEEVRCRVWSHLHEQSLQFWRFRNAAFLRRRKWSAQNRHEFGHSASLSLNLLPFILFGRTVLKSNRPIPDLKEKREREREEDRKSRGCPGESLSKLKNNLSFILVADTSQMLANCRFQLLLNKEMWRWWSCCLLRWCTT